VRIFYWKYLFCIDKSIILVYTCINDMYWSDIMQTRVAKWGNSQGVRLSKALLDALGLKTNDRVNVTVVNNSLVVTPEPEHDINWLLADYDRENRPNDYDWGEQMGREIWD
jgi:antitoxin MazE